MDVLREYDFNQSNGPVGNGWTTFAGGVVDNKVGPLASFGRDLATDEFDLLFNVPDGINKFMTVNFGYDITEPDDHHRVILGMAFGGGIQIQLVGPGGITSYNGGTQSASVAAGDTVRIRVEADHIYAYVNSVQLTDGPLGSAFTGTWLVVDTFNGDGASTTTVDDLSLLTQAVTLVTSEPRARVIFE